MARKGRQLEKLIELLEGIIAGTGIEIKSPDHIMGVKTKTLREVDVALRSKVGSTDILVVFECRDRKSIQDIT